MIKFHQVTKKFGSSKAIDDISLEIKPGELVFIIGASGAGKTTFLRLIIKDLIPSQGEIHIGKWKLSSLRGSKVAKLRQSIGVIFQDSKILESKTAYENVMLPLEIAGIKSRKAKKKTIQALDNVGLKHKAEQFPVQFSAGELQRISLARAIVSEPNLILADEPTGNLDPKTGREILNLLKKINKQGRTIVVATHDKDIVDSLKERVILLSEGKVIEDKSKSKYLLE